MTERAQRNRRRVIVLGVALGVFAVVDYFSYPYGGASAGQAPQTKTNGLWVRYTHYFGEKSETEVAALCRRLRESGMRDAFFHVREVKPGGTLRFRYPERARKLLAQVRREAPSVRAIAWVSVSNTRGGGSVVLSDTAVRKKLVDEARWLCTVCGFDGVQWDYEICDDGDPHLLALLEETRAALPAGKVLSVATPIWSPLRALGWSEGYFTQVAARCDQVAVMCYDTGMVIPRAYVALTEQNVVHVTSAVARGNPACQVLLGVPTYGPGLRSHNPHAESLKNALYGARAGRTQLPKASTTFAGVALFADYTTDDDEWRTYHALWASHF